MTTQEFSDEFDVMLNSYSTNGASIILNEYEKSVLLTSAQKALVLDLINGSQKERPFEYDERSRMILSNLIHKQGGIQVVMENGLHKVDVDIIEDALQIIDDEVIKQAVDNSEYEGIRIPVEVVSIDNIQRFIRNPFKINKDRVIRVFKESNNDQKSIRLYFYIDDRENYQYMYYYYYISLPSPIILVSLSEDGLSIDGENEITECKLNPIVHKEILERAVQMAIGMNMAQNKSQQK